ncbi:MAG TPA: helix-turn-helix domain-containing protein [Chromatiaceae bacterium]|nr:helix-turn-helix domain-containing protein [Chromatiaceae bacterium]
MRPDAQGRAKAIEAEAEQPAERLREPLGKTTPEQSLLRAARKALGLSQTQFAELIDMPVATLRDWEQGRFKPPGSALVLCRIALKHPEALLSVTKASNVLQ